jgi:shikimate dehydrogenase
MMAIPYAHVIGDPIAQSKSPLIHKFWLEKLGIEGDYSRQLVAPADLPVYLDKQRGDPAWRGCNVTIPHKQAVMPRLDRLDPLAEKIGAVNIVVREGDVLIGHNSDAPGFLEPLKPWLAERHLLRTARIIGTGGAARAIAHALWGEGFTLIFFARDRAKAEMLANEFDRSHAYVAPLAGLADAIDFDWGDTDGRLDLVVNATSLGMTGQPPLQIDFSNVPPGAIVYDAVYAPLETPLLAAARASGHPMVDGLSMLVGQARIAFTHFFGAAPPAQADEELRALLAA